MVSKRLLWVGGACYPLENIARVYTLTIHPRCKDAVVRFLKRAAKVTAVAIALTIIGSLTFAGNGDSDSELLTFVYMGALAAVIYSFVEMIQVLSAREVSAQPHFVLAVETSGPSQAVVTSRNPQLLHQLVGRIAYAIENPETEFQVKVETITISPKNYYFGDNVNMHGGSATTPAQERHRALMAVAGIAATVGTVGQPVIDAVNKILELL
ncbi:DUF6232 family protein [Streptomyces sp. DSM 41524]|uniref:DUF6232 family protein n=1 Tax=Streptomyces asiaticus subsp. ignotus TaxID=3098222 RepID=A0ABU7Q4B9_9ACTN|nr:DUF6232 family protein [Streptomyces sp. DSM 41524]